jgi:hypothetical protein
MRVENVASIPSSSAILAAMQSLVITASDGVGCVSTPIEDDDDLLALLAHAPASPAWDRAEVRDAETVICTFVRSRDGIWILAADQPAKRVA